MILILGGTSESLKIGRTFDKLKVEYLVSTTTDIQKNEINMISGKNIVIRFDEHCLVEFVHKYKIDTIIDATHPFATRIKEIAMYISKKLNVKYIRYERKKINIHPTKYITLVDSLEEAVEKINMIKGNIFVTTGAKELQYIYDIIGDRKNEIYVRVLPSSSSLKICENIGIPMSHIIAMVGPFDYEMNDYIIKKYKIKAIITKESGREGGLIEKVKAAKSNNVFLIIIKAPIINYPLVVYSISNLIEVLGLCQ